MSLGARMLVLATAALLVAASDPPAPKSDSEPTVVPLSPLGTQPGVPVLVNGHGPYLFLVDTGASGVARIDASVVKELKLPVVGTDTASGATGGAPVAIQRVAVTSLRVGKREYRDLQPLSRNYNTPGEYLPDIGGILALNLFKDELVTIDFPRRQLRIERCQLPPADGSTVLPYEERGGLVYVPVTLGNERLMALLDSGTDRAIDLPTSIIRKLRLANFPHPIGQAEGVTGKVGIAEANVDGDLRIGTQLVHRPAVTFSETFETPIIGSVLLHDFAVTIDQRNRRIRFAR